MSLEKKYIENATDDEIWGKFMNDLHSKAKLEISFDARFADTFKDYFKFVIDTHSSSQIFITKLKWVKKLNSLAY